MQGVSSATDVFGLGVLLFELLTGELPFPKASKRNPFPQVERAPASARGFRPTLPRALDDLLLACLAHDPAIRPGLPVLLPALHTFIRTGPRMWPAGFEPKPPGPDARAFLCSS